MNEDLSQYLPVDDAPDGLSDDEAAAALGYITTLGEQMMPKPEMGEDVEGDTEPVEGESEESEEQEAPKESKDSEQDAEIAAIRSELERLLKEEENGTETKDTEPVGEA